MSAPWFSRERRRVDVFRTSRKQRNGMLIFAPHPIPLPSFSKKYQGITLGSYDAAGSVDSAESGFSTSTPGQANSAFGLTAGDYLFVEGVFGRTLSVSPARFLAERTAAAGCLLLVACSANRPARDNQTNREDAGDRTVAHDYLVPMQVAPGAQQLRFSAMSVDGEVTAELAFRAGEAVFAKLVGGTHASYSFGKQLLRGFKLAAATGRIEFSGEPPADFARHTVLLPEAGKWLLPEDSGITPARQPRNPVHVTVLLCASKALGAPPIRRAQRPHSDPPGGASAEQRLAGVRD